MLVGFFGVGESMIELLEPLDAESDIALFLDRVGEGIHHVAYDVADIAEALRAAAASGLELIDQAPRSGARGTLIGFVNPLRSDGVLVEFVQDPHAPSGHTEGVS